MTFDNDKDKESSGFKVSSPKSRDSDGVRGGHRIVKSHSTKLNDFPCRRTVTARLRYGGQIQTYDCRDLDVDMGVWVIVQNDDVTRLGLVTSKPVIWPADQTKRKIFLPSDRRLLRVATNDDLAKQAENEVEERENFEFCQACVKKLGLVMKLVTVEKTFDNYKTIFYYTAEDRVDFRQLVRDLVRRLRTRIEMRQIIVRHESLMLGGNGMCGRPFCCSSFLSNFSPISVRMAKEQHMSINTMKISGVCGRLMCCLAYENAREASRESRESPENPENPENVVEFVENEEDGGLIPVTGDLGAGSKTRFSGRVVGPEAGPGEGDSRSPNGSNASGRRRERRRENDWNARRGLDDRKDGKERESRVETLDPETPAAGVSGKVDGDEAG